MRQPIPFRDRSYRLVSPRSLLAHGRQQHQRLDVWNLNRGVGGKRCRRVQRAQELGRRVETLGEHFEDRPITEGRQLRLFHQVGWDVLDKRSRRIGSRDLIVDERRRFGRDVSILLLLVRVHGAPCVRARTAVDHAGREARAVERDLDCQAVSATPRATRPCAPQAQRRGERPAVARGRGPLLQRPINHSSCPRKEQEACPHFRAEIGGFRGISAR